MYDTEVPELQDVQGPKSIAPIEPKPMEQISSYFRWELVFSGFLNFAPRPEMLGIFMLFFS